MNAAPAQNLNANTSGPEPYDIDFAPSPTRNLTPPPEVPHEEKNGPVIPSDSQATKSFNKELRLACFKEVKKPGRGEYWFSSRIRAAEKSIELLQLRIDPFASSPLFYFSVVEPRAIFFESH